MHNYIVGWFARDASVLRHVGLVLLPTNLVELKRTRRIIFADDLFQLSKVPSQKTVYIIDKAIENLSGCKFLYLWRLIYDSFIYNFYGWFTRLLSPSGKRLLLCCYYCMIDCRYSEWQNFECLDMIRGSLCVLWRMKSFGPIVFADQSPQHMNICQYIASNVPSLKGFHDKLTHQRNGVSMLKDLTLVMFSLQGYANLSFSILLLKLYFMFPYGWWIISLVCLFSKHCILDFF